MSANWSLTIQVLLATGLAIAEAAAVPHGETTLPAAANLAADGLTRPTNGVRLNLRGVPLDQVLDFLARAAGLVIEHKTDLHGTVSSVWSQEPMGQDETLDVVCAALKQNGYAVLRQGRLLTIVNSDQAKTSNLKVSCGNDPDAVAGSDETALQIIPLRYANASQLMNNLQTLLPATVTLSVNENANSLLLVATQNEIRRALRIVRTLDSSLATVSSLQVFPLRYADAKELATVLQQFFSSVGQNQSTTASDQGTPGFELPPISSSFGPPGSPATPDASSESSGSAARAKVTIAADERSNSLVVSAPADMFTTIARIVEQSDQQVVDTTV